MIFPVDIRTTVMRQDLLADDEEVEEISLALCAGEVNISISPLVQMDAV